MLICNVCRESNNHCHFFFYDFSDCNGSKKYCGDVKYQYSMQSCRSLLPRTPMQSAHVKIFGGNLKKCIQKIHSNFIKKTHYTHSKYKYLHLMTNIRADMNQGVGFPYSRQSYGFYILSSQGFILLLIINKLLVVIILKVYVYSD